MKIEGTEPEIPEKPKGQEQVSPAVRIEPVTEAQMANWSQRRRDEWAQLSEEDRVLWKVIYDEMRGIMDEPDAPEEPGEQAPEAWSDEDFDVEATARGLLAALMEEWEYDRWEREQEQEDEDDDAEDLVP